MKNAKQVVWSEGMLLGQQHFQVWDEYMHSRQDFLRETAAPLCWGIVNAAIDQEALQNGLFQLNDFAAIFPDGTVATRNPDAAPLSCRVEADGQGNAEIHLGVPANRMVSGITGYRETSSMTGLLGQYSQVADLYDHARTREVLVGRPNVVLLGGAASRDAFVSFKLAELVSEGDRGFRLSSDHIPPVAWVRASPVLLGIVDKLIDVIRAKVRALSERRHNRSASVAEFSNADVAHFWLLNALNKVLPELTHLRREARVHPERLYSVLSRFAGELCTFSLSYGADRLPRYDHADLGQTFRTLEHDLRDLIDTVIPSNFTITSLERETDALYSAKQFDWQVLDSATFYLGVKLDAEGAKWVDQFERTAKIGSRDMIEMIVGSALPGVQMHHQHRPPSMLPIRSRFEYFRLDTRNEFWEAVSQSSSIAVYVPQMFTGATIELICVQE